MLQSNAQSDLALVKAVLSGDSKAANRFLDVVSTTLWTVVVRLEGDGQKGEAAFLEVIAGIKADDFRRLRAFDGRAPISTYLAIVARDILGDRLARSFINAPSEAWAQFERFFGDDIRRRVVRRFPRDAGTAAREDVYQEICFRLVEDDFRRVRSYNGHGSFIGYILTVVERILIDLIRRDAPRRRLPAAVARLSELDQAVYAAIAWEDVPPDPERLIVALQGRSDTDPDPERIRQAIARVGDLVRREPAGTSGRRATVSLDSATDDGEELAIADPGMTPEEQLLAAEEEQARGALIASVKAAAANLPTDERLYLQVVFSATDPMPPREIAKLMSCAVEDVYRLKQRIARWITEISSQLEKKQSQSV